MAKGVSTPVGGIASEGDKSTIGDTIDAFRLHRPTGCMTCQSTQPTAKPNFPLGHYFNMLIYWEKILKIRENVASYWPQ
jgi:hypothetical protein